jgi:hypothetical protein
MASGTERTAIQLIQNPGRPLSSCHDQHRGILCILDSRQRHAGMTDFISVYPILQQPLLGGIYYYRLFLQINFLYPVTSDNY